MALPQVIPMIGGSTLALKPGLLFQVLDDGAVSVVDPSTRTVDILDNPKGNPAPAWGSFGIPNPIRGAAGRLQGTLNVLSGCVGGAIAVAPYTPIVLIPGGMSVVKGLSAVCQQWRETTTQLEPDARGIFNGEFSALYGTRSTILSDTMKIASLVRDLTMLPLHFVAGLQPLGQKASVVVDMITDENVGLAQIHQEIINKNINNITKLTLVAAVGSGGLMGVCFLGAVAALVLGLVMIPVFCSLLVLVVLGLLRSKRVPSSPPTTLDVQSLPSPTHELYLSPKSSCSYFL